MKALAIVITKAPFGTIDAAEALRFANGAVTYGHEVSLILVNDGVLVAKKGQKAEASGATSLSPLIEKLAKQGSNVYVDASSLRKIGLNENDIVKGAKFVDSSKISWVLVTSERTAIF